LSATGAAARRLTQVHPDGGRRPAKFFQAEPRQTKQNQRKPRKTKKNSLDFLGFIRANRDFSIGYDDSEGKNLLL
jgi:hypothetical protein